MRRTRLYTEGLIEQIDLAGALWEEYGVVSDIIVRLPSVKHFTMI